MSDELMLRIGPTPGDEAYLNLGRAIAGQCPRGFDEARLEADLAGAAPEMSLACTPEGGSETPVALDPTARTRIREMLEQIRDKTPSEDQRLWHKCTVILRKGGRFQMDVQY